MDNAKPTASSRFSFTAHYTGHVWARNGLSHPALHTDVGAALHAALRPLRATLVPLAGGIDLDAMLLARHRLIDALLTSAVTDRGVARVVELAAGLSPRGITFSRRHGVAGLTYVETDLPAMAAAKAARLDAASLCSDGHVVLPLDALRDDGPHSLRSVLAQTAARPLPTAVISEGLINYFDEHTTRALWRRIASALHEAGGGVYFADYVLPPPPGGMRSAVYRAFRRLLEIATRGRTHSPWDSAAALEEELREAGFGNIRVHDPDGAPNGQPAPYIRVIEAWTAPR